MRFEMFCKCCFVSF